MNAVPPVLALALGGLLLLAAVLALALRRLRASAPAPLYLDEGPNSRTFASTRFRLRAKPDKLEGRTDDATLVELKSRAHGVRPSDRAQVIATALAVRGGGVAVRRARVETRDGAPVTIDLDESDDALFARIAPAVAAVRLVARGIAPTPLASFGKCRACGYRASCPHRADGG